jgi:hypothetical protein
MKNAILNILEKTMEVHLTSCFFWRYIFENTFYEKKIDGISKYFEPFLIFNLYLINIMMMSTSVSSIHASNKENYEIF